MLSRLSALLLAATVAGSVGDEVSALCDACPGGLTVELLGYTAVSLAAAAYRTRQHPGDGLAAGVAVAAVGLYSALPMVSPRWAVLAVVAGPLAAWWVDDPARRRLRRG